jgi:lambda repressor-like predicted transcriptional regulator
MAIAERTNPAAELLTQNVRIFLEVRSAYDECDPEIKAVIDEMVEICSSQSATEEEKQRAVATIVEGLFPSLAVDFLNSCEAVRKSAGAKASSEKMAEEENVFAERVQARMDELKINQEELARRIGVGQSAISNMLNRECRPQKRTIRKISQALDISPDQIWPGFDQEAN